MVIIKNINNKVTMTKAIKELIPFESCHVPGTVLITPLQSSTFNSNQGSLNCGLTIVAILQMRKLMTGGVI